MNNSFDTTAWVVQSILIFFGLIAFTPVVRAVLGLTLIAAAQTFGSRESKLYAGGVRVLPPFLRTALGVTTALTMSSVMLTQPAMAEEIPIIDRVVHMSQEAATIELEPHVTPRDESTATTMQATPSHSYTVQAGDSLWKIAHDYLATNNATVTSSMIDEQWRAIWAHNKDVIGADPSRILPGQVLWINDDRSAKN